MNTKIESGYIFKEHKPEHKKFGSANQIGGAIVLPGGHWAPYLPISDQQQNIGVEPEDCTSEGTLDALQTLARFVFNDSTEWSKRYLAWASGTTATGNDPMTVLESLQAKGTVPETDWPNTAALTTWSYFYTTPPPSIQTKADEYIAQYAPDGEWVDTDVNSLMAALEYSPLGVAGYAWQTDPATGYYITPPGAAPCHWFALVDYVENEYWVAFDSYQQDIKKLAWNYTFNEAMRYGLVLNPVNPTAWQQFLNLMRSILGL